MQILDELQGNLALEPPHMSLTHHSQGWDSRNKGASPRQRVTLGVSTD